MSGSIRLVSAPCDPEVDDLPAIVAAANDIGRLDVPVHETARVRSTERGQHLFGDLLHLIHRQRAARHLLGQARPGEQLHDEEGVTALDQAVVHRDDVRVVQPGRCARLPVEPVSSPQICARVQVDRLDGDGTVQHGVMRPPDLPHATGPDLLVESIARPDELPGDEWFVLAHAVRP